MAAACSILSRCSHVWVKLSAPYRHDRGPLNTRPDREWLAALIAAAPDRCVWGSDWPHPPPQSSIAAPRSKRRTAPLSYDELVDEFPRRAAVGRPRRAHHERQRRARCTASSSGQRAVLPPEIAAGGRQNDNHRSVSPRRLSRLPRCRSARTRRSAFPSHPVKFIVPFPAGGINDVLARIAADKLQAKWGQPIIIEQKTGAGGNIGADAAAKAEPDGHTLFVSAPGPLSINQSLYKKLSYKPLDFVPITVLGAVPNVVIVKKDLPVNSLQGVDRLREGTVPARSSTAARAPARRRISPPTCS